MEALRARFLSATPLRADVRSGAWWLLVGAAAGALAGLVVGGVGGRLAMLLLRLTSPDFVGGLSDDGFEIGVVSHRTLQLFGAAMQIGALNGLGYVAARPFLRPRLRLPVWTLAGGAVGGAALVHGDGVDFLLRPQWLAVGAFVALPAAGAAATVLLVERWSRIRPWTLSRTTVGGAVAALAAFVALALALPVALGALVLARLEPLRALARTRGRLAAALLLVVVVAVALANLLGDVRTIFAG